MKQIPLTQGKFALVDDEDFEYLNQFKWCALKRPHTFYAVRNLPNGKGKQKLIGMHRVILKVTDGEIECDHIDWNGLNNQKSNLRLCTSAQNEKNKKPIEGRASKYKGVCWHKGAKKWYSQIIIKNKKTYLGCFIDEIEAAKAYDEMAKLHFGEFAYLNFKE